MRIISWNVNGLRAAARKGFPAWLAGCGASVVALQEIRATPAQLAPEVRSPPGYHVDWLPALRPGYSGVATFSRAAPLAVSSGLGLAEFDAEGRVLVTRYPAFSLYNVYVPSGTSGPARIEFKLAFTAALHTALRTELAAGQPLVVVGDLNTAYSEIDLARPRENQRNSGFLPVERTALGELFALGLVDSFRHLHPDLRRYSWWTQRAGARARDVGWRIDYILISSNLVPYLVAAATHPEQTGSDHCPVSADFCFSGDLANG